MYFYTDLAKPHSRKGMAGVNVHNGRDGRIVLASDPDDVVRDAAAKQEGLVTVKGEFGSWPVVMPVVARQVLRTLNSDAAFRGSVRNRVAEVLRGAHLVNADPAGVTAVRLYDAAAPGPEGGAISLRSSIGLGSASVLEAEPEAWNRYVLGRIAAGGRSENLGQGETCDITMDDAREVRVLVVGAGERTLSITRTPSSPSSLSSPRAPGGTDRADDSDDRDGQTP